MSIENTLAERGNRYGDFTDHARLCQDLKAVMATFAVVQNTPNGVSVHLPWGDLPATHKQALEVIADKIARILSGDPNYADNWHDIQGYAKLVEDRLPKTEQQEHTDTLAQFDEWRDALRGGSGGGSHTVVLPDGSAFGVVSFPLSKDHWLYADRAYEDGADQPKELPAPILNHGSRETVVAAARYAVRGATNCGKEPDFDPDALVQNMVYALCGPYGGAFVQPPEASIDPADVDISDAGAHSDLPPGEWRAGDVVVALHNCDEQFTRLKRYTLRSENQYETVKVVADDRGEENGWGVHNFRFHSRPTK